MLRQYISQSFSKMRETPLLALISVAGTALAIALIMVLVIAWQVRMASYYPETNRDRTLYIRRGNYVAPGTQSNYNNSMRIMHEAFYPVRSAEAVTAVSPYNPRLISIPAGTSEFKADVSYTDAAFWTVFPFRFIAGSAFTEADVTSGIHRAVINEALARGLYGTTDVVGRTVLISYAEYTICGVVPVVSTLAECAYGEVWLPHTSTTFTIQDWSEDSLGPFCCYMLARSRSDFRAIKEETERNVKQFNSTLADGEYRLNSQPDTHFEQLYRRGSMAADVPSILLRFAIVLLILLLVPAINLSGITLAGMNKQLSEIGVRKAFGANRSEIMMQVLSENLVLTLLGGLFGLALSYPAILFMSDWLLKSGNSSFLDGAASVHTDMILSPAIFGAALLFCLVLNLLSAGIPAWRASGTNIVNALNQQ